MVESTRSHPSALGDVGRVARRILAQITRDPRFLVFSTVAPVLLVLLLKYVFEGVHSFQLLGIPINDYALPAAGFFVFFFTYILCTIVLIRERREGTLGRMFAAGYRRTAVVLGYVVGYSTIAIVQTSLAILTTVWGFQLRLGETAVPVVATTMVLSMVSLALGVFVSTVARTEGQIFPSIPAIIVPSLLVSGLVIPHDELPRWARVLSYAIPLTYAEKVLLGLMRDGKPFADLLGWFLGLVAFGVGLLLVASLTVREVE